MNKSMFLAAAVVSAFFSTVKTVGAEDTKGMNMTMKPRRVPPTRRLRPR
jgi:hypothetical protein